jgi:hypothetical protein
MPKIKFKFLPIVVLGLMATSMPAHAEGSLFDSWNKKITDSAHTIGDKIKKYYGDYLPTTPPNTNPVPTTPTPPVQPRVPTPAEVVRTNLSQCNKFLGLMYSPSYENDPKKIASLYLNAALDFTEADFDHKPSADELEERNKCVELALLEGADPDSNGRTKNDDQLSFDVPTPLARAVRDNDGPAVKTLLDHKANPNIQDASLGNPVPLLNLALNNSQEISIDLINAGADLTTPHLLWMAAGNAADKVVDLLIQSKKIPVNELNKFTDYSDEEGETALDASESRLFALVTYQKKFASDSKISPEDKLSEANRILYYNYPLKPQLKTSEVDPDAFMNDLLTHQQKVSDSLKAAGWVCKQENCGIVDYSN